MMNPNMLARYDQWRQARIPRYAGGTNQVTAAGLARGGAMPLPYQNPDGMVRWDPATGRYITVPPAGTNTTPPPPWMGAMPRSINSQYWNDWTSAPPPDYSQDMWNQRFTEVDQNATPSHQLPAYEQSLSSHDPATWERIFQMYDQSQLAAAQAKWDADMAQYGGMLPGGGIMGPRPTGSAPASMTAGLPTPPRISDQQMFDYYTQLAALKGADGTIDPTAAAALMSSMRGNAGFNELPGSIRAAISRFNGEQGWNGQQNPQPQYSADNLQALLDALAGRGFNAPPPPPREPYRGPRDQTKEIMARRVADGSGAPVPPPPPPDGGGEPDPWQGATDEDKRRWLGDSGLWKMSQLTPELGAAAIARAKLWLGTHGLTPANPNYERIMTRVKQWAIGASAVHPAQVLATEYMANAGDWQDPPPGPIDVPTPPDPTPPPPPVPDPTPPPPTGAIPPPTGNTQGGGPAPININVGAPPTTPGPPPAATPTAQNPQGIVYGGNVWDKALKTAMSGKTAGSNTGTNLFSLQGSPDQVVPKLPAFQQMNYTKWNQIRNATPDAFNFLKGAYSAGNRDLDSEYQQMKYNAPIGDARYTSGIRTTR